MNPKVSVVVPVYNVEFYLDRCLRSLVEQDFEQPYEVLVVDDGTPDESPAIIEEYASRFPDKVRAFRKENGGHGSACNHGFERARGDYLMIVDGDDFLGPSVLREMWGKAEETGVDVLIGNLLYHFEEETKPYRPLEHISGEKLLDRKDLELLFKNWPTPCGRLYRRSLFENPAVRMLEGVIHADVSFAPKTYLSARSICYVNREWYDYDLTRPDQSMKATSRKIMDVVPNLRNVLDFAKSEGHFEAFQHELEYYTLAHALSWMPRCCRLNDYPRDQAMREVFQVMDDYFPSWETGKAFTELRPHPLAKLNIQVSKRTGFRTYVARAEFKRAARRAYQASARVANLPVRAVEKGRRLFERVFGDINAAF